MATTDGTEFWDGLAACLGEADVPEALAECLDAVPERLEEIEALAQEYPDEALNRLTALTSAVSVAIAAQPPLLARMSLRTFTIGLVSAVRSVAQNLHAASFTISTGLPAGVSVSLEFAVPPPPVP